MNLGNTRRICLIWGQYPMTSTLDYCLLMVKEGHGCVNLTSLIHVFNGLMWRWETGKYSHDVYQLIHDAMRPVLHLSCFTFCDTTGSIELLFFDMVRCLVSVWMAKDGRWQAQTVKLQQHSFYHNYNLVEIIFQCECYTSYNCWLRYMAIVNTLIRQEISGSSIFCQT